MADGGPLAQPPASSQATARISEIRTKRSRAVPLAKSLSVFIGLPLTVGTLLLGLLEQFFDPGGFRGTQAAIVE